MISNWNELKFSNGIDKRKGKNNEYENFDEALYNILILLTDHRVFFLKLFLGI